MNRLELSWHERGRLWTRIGIRTLLIVVAVLLVRSFAPPLLELFMPFVLALLVAWLLNPIVKWLQKHIGLPRGFLSLVLILLLFFVVGGVLFALGAALVSEVSALVANWDEISRSLDIAIQNLGRGLDTLVELFPASITEFMAKNLDRLSTWLSAVMNTGISSMGSHAKDMAFSLPSFAVSLIVFIMASYFITSDYPRLRLLITEHMPEGMRGVFSNVKKNALGAFSGYFRAQLILSMGVFIILLFAFFFLDQGYAFLLALALAVLDFIPIIGSGTIMLPWAVIDAFAGNWRHAIGLLVAWGIICVFRRVAEAKVVGSQTGLSPVLSLASMYIGMKVAGVLGMILGPVLCLVLIGVVKTGIFSNVFADFALAFRDISAMLSPRCPPPEAGD